MTTPLTFLGESAAIGEVAARLTVVEGSCFCISGRTGDIRPDHPHGLFHGDVRYLSQLEVRVDGLRPEPLSATVCDHVDAQIAARAFAGDARHPLVLLRRRVVRAGLREELFLHNYEDVDVDCTVDVHVDADFASIFVVKEDGTRVSSASAIDTDERSIRLENDAGAATTITADQPIEIVHWRTMRFAAHVPSRASWSATVDITLDDPDGGHPSRDTAPTEVGSPTRAAAWQRRLPTIHTQEPRLAHGCRASVRDLGALLVPHRGEQVIAAGVPWFLTLFGRDSLLTSWFALLADPELAAGSLRALASHQGERVDAASEEEPGRIPHELRTGPAAAGIPGGKGTYYGSADATLLFVMLVGELHRWGAPRETVAPLLPHVDRALAWLDSYGDRDGDGFVEYQRTTNEGLEHQGWKDSWDAVSSADGQLAEPPIAPCEVQAYAYGALMARADLADAFDGLGAATSWRERAKALQRAFDERYWVSERGTYAVALDADKRPVDAVTSNAGHCLWTGIALPHRASAVAASLLSDELFSGWGIRTLATTMGRYHPLSYHNGSVWPHDNAIAAAGLRRYGFVDEAHRVIEGMLAASTSYGGHLPELFGGVGRREFGAPVDYAAASIPQAWAAGSMLSFVRTLLGLEPDVPRGEVTIDGRLPAWCRSLEIQRMPLAGARVTVRAAHGGDEVDVEGLPAGIDVRSPAAAT